MKRPFSRYTLLIAAAILIVYISSFLVVIALLPRVTGDMVNFLKTSKTVEISPGVTYSSVVRYDIVPPYNIIYWPLLTALRWQPLSDLFETFFYEKVHKTFIPKSEEDLNGHTGFGV
jgi:hypothetical protein